VQHLDGSGTPVLYIGRTVIKGYYTLQCSTQRTSRSEPYGTVWTNQKEWER